MLQIIRRSIVLLALATALMGVAYPLVITGLAQTVFPDQTDGSLIEDEGRHVGSALLGQAFAGPGYFHSRPSLTGETPYDGLGSDAGNLSPASGALRSDVEGRIALLRSIEGQRSEEPVPIDLVTGSASGLDPHISVAAARYQAARIAAARGVSEDTVHQLIDSETQERLFGIFGERVVHVVRINLALDRQSRRNGRDAETGQGQG